MIWTSIECEKPEEGRDLFYFFSVLGIYRGQYARIQYPQEFTGTDEPIYDDQFFGEKGFLTGDVEYWMYADGYPEGEFPPIPTGYIEITQGKWKEYALRSDTVRITKREYESLKETVKYYEGGHLYEMCCLHDNCPCNIYWDDEDGVEGYKCVRCKTVYPTEDVEGNPYKYRSKFDRPCLNCNPHEEDTPEFYQNGFLEYTEGVEPYSTEHYVCDKCCSTYNIEEI